MTKESVNYRIPEHCCGNCTSSYRNLYGDFQCGMLGGDTCIDYAGVCDRWIESKEPLPEAEVTPDLPTKTEPECRHCDTCEWYSSPYCTRTYDTVKNVTKGCKDYEPKLSDTSVDAITPAVQVDTATCETCISSGYDSFNRPFCNHLGKSIAPNDTCEEWCAIPRDHVCATCKYSYFAEPNMPVCSRSAQPIKADEIDLPCYDYEAEEGETNV